MFVGSRVTVLNENVFPLEIGTKPVFEALKFVRIQRAIDFTPANFAFARGFTDEKLVLRQTTGVLAGAHHQGPQMTQARFITANGLFVKGRRGQIPIDTAEIVQAEMFKAFFMRLRFPGNCFHRWILQRGRGDAPV